MMQHITAGEGDSAHLCMRFSITVKMGNNPVAFSNFCVAALVALGIGPLDRKTDSVPMQSSSSSNVLCQQEKGHGPMQLVTARVR